MKSLLTCALLAAIAHNYAIADETTQRLTGLFCNTEAQIDEALSYLRHNLPPRAAVALTNNDAVVCNYADTVEYVVRAPVDVGRVTGLVPLVKYRATLVAVVIGKRLREIEPPVTIFFVTPNRLTTVFVERGT
jgi:hypothetical protein